ncbi:hypothetical protein [Bradyrhizobium sp. USDA 4504]
MATVFIEQPTDLFSAGSDTGNLAFYDPVSGTAEQYIAQSWVLGTGRTLTLFGTGFTYNSFGVLTAGIVTRYVEKESAYDITIFDIQNIAVSVAAFSEDVAEKLFTGDDTFVSTADNDFVPFGPAIPNVIKGYAGNDTATDNPGADDTFLGGDGLDTFVFAKAFKDVQFNYGLNAEVGPPSAQTAEAPYFLYKNVVGYEIGHIYFWGDSKDGVKGVERFSFSDGVIDRADGNGLVDDLFYNRKYGDVWNAKVDADQHYNNFGWKEGRDPNLLFQTNLYNAANPDVKAAKINPLQHYHESGWKEGRDPGPWFDTTLYLLRNPDVKAAAIDPLEHYLNNGQSEGREIFQAIGSSIVNGFDAEYYLMHNPDVAAAGVDPLQHYNTFGWKEGRNPNAYFDDVGYLEHYDDVRNAGVNPLQHYEQWGWKEGRDPSASFDTQHYLQSYSDVATAHISPLDHYLKNGIYEGRSAFGDESWHLA